MIQAVIYDLDDLMVDSDKIHFQAWKSLFENHGLKFELPGHLHKQLIGRRIVDILEILIDHFSLNVNFDSFFHEREAIFVDLIKKNLEALPGMENSIQFCRDQNLRTAIASSGTNLYIQAVIEKFSLHSDFDSVITGDDVKEGKPHPEVYLTAAQKLETPPENCLVLEDAQKGIEAAKAAGCICWAVEAGNTPPQDRSQADLIMPTLKEFSGLFKERWLKS